MARKRNNQTAENQVTADEQQDNSAEEMAALEAMLNGEDAEVETDPAPEAADETQEASGETSEAPAEEPNPETEGGDEDDELAAALENGEEAEDPAEFSDDSKAKSQGKAEGGQKAKTPRTKLPFDETIKAMFSEEPCVLDVDEGELSEQQLEDTLINAVTQKKVREKVVNLLQSFMSGGRPSRYTDVVLDMLVKASMNDETVTLQQIKAAYEELGLGAGTINAQSGQMMALFPVLRIASKPERGVLKPNKNSVIIDAMASQ